jgi:hypothetical protein
MFDEQGALLHVSKMPRHVLPSGRTKAATSLKTSV